MKDAVQDPEEANPAHIFHYVISSGYIYIFALTTNGSGSAPGIPPVSRPNFTNDNGTAFVAANCLKTADPEPTSPSYQLK